MCQCSLQNGVSRDFRGALTATKSFKCIDKWTNCWEFRIQASTPPFSLQSFGQKDSAFAELAILTQMKALCSAVAALPWGARQFDACPVLQPLEVFCNTSEITAMGSIVFYTSHSKGCFVVVHRFVVAWEWLKQIWAKPHFPLVIFHRSSSTILYGICLLNFRVWRTLQILYLWQ